MFIIPETHTPNSVRKIYDAIFSCVFLTVLSLPACFHFFGSNDSSYIRNIESRLPASPPPDLRNVQAIRAFPAETDAYLADHFGLREPLIGLYSRLMYASGKSVSDDVVIGFDGWLYFEKSVEQYRGLNNLNSSGLRHWTDQFLTYNDWLEDRGIKLLIVVAPDKCEIVTQHVPSWVQKGSNMPINQLEEYVDNRDIDLNIIRLTDPLIEASAISDVFLKFDTHWNAYGAYIGYSRIMEEIEKSWDDCGTLDLGSDFALSPSVSRRGNLSRRINLPGLVEPNALSIEISEASDQAVAELFNGSGFEPSTTVEVNNRKRITHFVNPDVAGPRVMLVRDSFSDLLIPYFRETFPELWVAHHWTMQKYHADLVEQFSPDVVVYEILASSLRDPLPPFPGHIKIDQNVSYANFDRSSDQLSIEGVVQSGIGIDEIVIESELGMELGKAQMNESRPTGNITDLGMEGFVHDWVFNTVQDERKQPGRFVSIIYKSEGYQIGVAHQTVTHN